MKRSITIAGGGAAGFFAAINAARMTKDVHVRIIEKTGRLLSKVKVSGGGRCNVCHHCFTVDDLVKNYPRGKNFLKKAFHTFSTKDTVEWFAERNVKLKAEADGRMFPVTNNSQTIINCLLHEAGIYGVEILTNAEVRHIEKSGNIFTVQTGSSQYQSDFLVLACGGFPKEAHFEWIRTTGHSMETPVPSLFTFNMPGHSITKLMGISVPAATIKITGTKFIQQGPLLITHWGLSGPAVLKLSAWHARDLAARNYTFDIMVNWLQHYTQESLRDAWQQLRAVHARRKIYDRNPFELPARLWQWLLEESEIKEDARWADINTRQQNRLTQNLTAHAFSIKGKTTFKEEFVTCGGVKLQEIDAHTMQSRIVPGLYFAGEIMDVDGITGGFNFQHAWTSGYLAAKDIAEKCR